MADTLGVELRRCLTPLVRGAAGHVARRGRDAWQVRKPIWIPKLRHAGKAVAVAAALAALITLGVTGQLNRQLAGASPLASDPAVAEGEGGSAFVPLPSPWDVVIEKVRDVAPAISTPHVGFVPLGDLSLTLEADADTGGASRGTAAGQGGQPLLMSTPSALVVALAVAAAVAVGLVRRLRRGGQGRTSNGDSQPTVDASDIDAPKRDTENAVRHQNSSPGSADASGQPVFPPQVDLLSDENGEGLLQPEPEAASLTSQAAGTATTATEAGDAATAHEGSRTDTSPSTRTPPATPQVRTHVRPEDSASRVVLFTATRWQG